EAGYVLGFSPAAFVWHRPRGTVRAYWRQQREYGRAEALLERKWPDKYRGGRARWAGRLYARGLLPGLGRWRVYYGTWGSELLQSLARMRGRLGRAAPARARAGRFAAPLPRVLTEWTEAWQSGERRLTEIERRLRAGGAIVARGGTYDRWDLQARRGFIGSVR